MKKKSEKKPKDTKKVVLTKEDFLKALKKSPDLDDVKGYSPFIFRMRRDTIETEKENEHRSQKATCRNFPTIYI